MADPSLELAAIGLARWLENSRAFCGALPLVPAGGFALCAMLLLRGLLSIAEGLGLTELFFPYGESLSLGQELLLATGCLDVLACLAGVAGLGGRSVQLVKVMAFWLLARVGLGLALAVLYFFEEDLGRGGGTHMMALRLAVAATLLAVDLELLWTGARLVLATMLNWLLAPSLLYLICKAQGIALARRDTYCAKRHLLAALLADHETSRMLEVAHADVELMRTELVLPCDSEEELQSRGFLDAVQLGDDLEGLFHTALHLQVQAGDATLRVDHVLEALCRSDEIRLRPRGPREGRLELSTHACYRVDGHGISEQARAIRTNLTAVQALQSKPPEESTPMLLGPLRLPLEEAVLVYAMARFFVAVLSLASLAAGYGNFVQLVSGHKVTARASRFVEVLQCMWSLGFNGAGILAILRHRRTRKAVQAAALECGGSNTDTLHQAFDRVRTLPDAQAWLNAFRISAGGMALLLAWGPAELLMDFPIVGLALFRADVCRAYSAGLARVGSSHIIPLVAQVPLHCTHHDVGVLAAAGVFFLLKLYMCWAVLSLWHQYAFGWTTTDLRGAAYLILNPFQPAFGFGERQKLLP